MAYPVVTGILWQLQDEETVRQEGIYGPWRLAE